MPIVIQSDWTEIDSELDRLETVLESSEARGRLEAVLDLGFEETQMAVHVITESLKRSGRTSSSVNGDTWEGEIAYGGPSGWINDPVTYARYEMNRGGEHDWFRNLDHLHSLWEEAVAGVLAGRAV